MTPTKPPVQQTLIADDTPTLALDQIHIDPDHNVRQDVTDDTVADLADSIQALGVHTAILVTRTPDADRPYRLLAGYRRCHAAALVEQRTKTPVKIPYTVVDGDEADLEAAHLLENLHRQDLNPIEEATGIARLVELGKTQRSLAGEIGRSESHIAGRLKLLQLPAAAVDAVKAGHLNLGTAMKLVDAGPDIADQAVATAAEVQRIQREKAQQELDAAKDRLAQARKDAKSKDNDVPADVLAEMADEVAEWQAEIDDVTLSIDDWAIDQAVRRRHEQEAHHARITDLHAGGVEVLILTDGKKPPKGAKQVAGSTYQNGMYLGDDGKTNHEAEPCRLVVFTQQWSDRVVEQQWCTDPKRHTPAGDSDLKVPDKAKNEPSPAEKKRRQKEADYEAKVLGQLQDAVTGGVTKAQLGDLAVDMLLASAWNSDAKAACKLLGLDRGHEHAVTAKGDGTGEFLAKESLERYEAASKANADRGRYARLLAHHSFDVVETYAPRWSDPDGPDRVRLDHLKAKGFRPGKRPA